MIALAALILGLVVGWAAGGSIAGLSNASLRFWWPVFALFIAQGVARGRVTGANATTAGLAIWAVCCAVLIVLLLPDWRQPGIWVLGIGLALNLCVVLLNGGMPVSIAGASVSSGVSQSVRAALGFYQMAGPGTVAPVLGDVIPLGIGSWRTLVSAGDVLLVVGVAIFVVNAMLNRDEEPDSADMPA